MRLERTVIDVRGESVQPFIATPASQQSIDAYANGEINWSYQEKRAAVLLSQGNLEGADDAFSPADALVAERIENGESCLNLQLIKLRNREDALWQQSLLHPDSEQLRNQLGRTQD